MEIYISHHFQAFPSLCKDHSYCLESRNVSCQLYPYFLLPYLLTWKLYWETNEGMSIKLDSNFRMTNILLSIFHLGFLRRKISCCGAPTTTARASKASSSYWYVHRKSPSELFCSRENQSNARHHQHSGHQQQQQWKFWPESCVCVCARTYRTLSHWVNTECVLQY